MGHRDSSAQLGGHSGFCAADGRTAAPAPPRGFAPSRTAETQRVNAASKSIGARVLLFLLRGYMIFLSPFFGGACKFQPSCSNYAYEAIALHGPRHGTLLAMKRLLRCRPFTVGGFDPVPEPESFERERLGTTEDRREPIQ
jgi:uncharacterized protein